MSAPAIAGPVAVPGSEEEVPRLAEAFATVTLPQAEWTHRAHLLVALWYATGLPPDQALAAMRNGIQRLNAAHGLVTTATRGYHETITRAYMRLIVRFVEEDQGEPGWAARAQRLLARHGERDHLLRYYSRERLAAPEARFGWLEPDLAPLP